MDPLDPLTEIINSGQAFSLAIALERFIWLMIGFFFLGAISTSVTKGIFKQTWVAKILFSKSFKMSNRKDKVSQQYSREDK